MTAGVDAGHAGDEQILLTGARLLSADGEATDTWIEVVGDRVHAVGQGSAPQRAGAQEFDVRDLLVPARTGRHPPPRRLLQPGRCVGSSGGGLRPPPRDDEADGEPGGRACGRARPPDRGLGVVGGVRCALRPGISERVNATLPHPVQVPVSALEPRAALVHASVSVLEILDEVRP